MDATHSPSSQARAVGEMPPMRPLRDVPFVSTSTGNASQERNRPPVYTTLDSAQLPIFQSASKLLDALAEGCILIETGALRGRRIGPLDPVRGRALVFRRIDPLVPTTVVFVPRVLRASARMRRFTAKIANLQLAVDCAYHYIVGFRKSRRLPLATPAPQSATSKDFTRQLLTYSR